MSTLRVLLSAVPDAGRADAWTLFDENEVVVQSGRGPPDAWPAAERRDAVLAASCVRIVGLRLPPMPANRVAAAASFALEDQLAGPADEQHIAVSLQQSDGTVETVVANRELVASLAANFDRVLAESTLAPRPQDLRWHWYPSGAGGGFVRKPDGSAFATSEHPGVPVELTLALDHTSHSEGDPVGVAMAFLPDETTKADVARRAGTTFTQTALWRWEAAGSAAFAGATDLRQGEFASTTPTTDRGPLRLFRVAAVIAAAAIAVHIFATIGEWATVRIEAWNAKSDLAALARDAGIIGADTPAIGIAKRYADARHRAGLAAPSDALPLLARAAPALAALPAGTLKLATYADGHWTVDLAKPDDNLTTQLERQLANAGLTTLQATNAAGARMRVSLENGAP